MPTFLALLVAACAPSAPPPPPEPVAEAPAPSEPAPDAGDAAVVAAQDAAKALLGTLKERLVTVMGAEGPEAAAKVCSEEAQALTARVAAEKGIAVGRASLRLRNPANAGPDWVQAWLTEQGERPAEGVGPRAEVVQTAEGAVARVILPIPVAEPCLACHGPAEGIAAPVKDLLARSYPDDKAVGYAAGDLRGAAWAEVKVATASTAPGGER